MRSAQNNTAPPDERGITDTTPLREALADLEHTRWSRWMEWMFSVGTLNPDGTWTMPADKVERWTRQMNTPYTELSEREKDSDRKEADNTLSVIDQFSATS